MNDLRTAAQQALEAMLNFPGDISDEMFESIRALKAALAQQAESLNLSDPAVRKRLASQWGYVHEAQQAEPVEEHKYWCASLTQLLLSDPPKRAPCDCKKKQAEPVEPVAWQCQEHGDSEWFDCGKESYGINPRRYTYRALYTAPPQRKPLPKHDQHCVDVPGYGLMAVRLVRAVERAHGIKE